MGTPSVSKEEFSRRPLGKPSRTIFLVFSCPQQLNRWPCHSLTDSLSHWGYFYFWHYRVTPPRDLWPLRHLIRVMRKHDLTNMLKILTFFDNFQQFLTILTIFNFFGNFDIFWQFWPFLTILTIFDNSDHFYNFWQFWQFSTMLTIFDNFDHFQQFLTILTNFDLWHLRHWLQFWQLKTLNSWQSLLPDN